MSTTPHFGNDLVDHLFPLQPPRTTEVAENMDYVRAEFTALGHLVAELTPAGPDQTIAIRKLHEAQMAAIGNLALNQPTDDPAPGRKIRDNPQA